MNQGKAVRLRSVTPKFMLRKLRGHIWEIHHLWKTGEYHVDKIPFNWKRPIDFKYIWYDGPHYLFTIGTRSVSFYYFHGWMKRNFIDFVTLVLRS